MIIPIDGKNWQDDYLVILSGSVNAADVREYMARNAKVTEGSYAYRLIEDLYEGVFIRSLELVADYTKYFEIEYLSFGEYLRRRRRFASAVVATLEGIEGESGGIYHYRPHHSFIEGEYGYEFLTRVFGDSLSGGAT